MITIVTNYWENLDVILSQYRLNFLNAYKFGDFVTAAELLFARNAAHPPEAHLDDMPKFTIRSTSLRTMIDLPRKAKHYCDNWNPRLEQAMALYRKRNLENYNRV
jgi:hypothetical protein